MLLTPEVRDIGRRNFLRALAGAPAVAALGAAAGVSGPVPGGPVRIGFIGVGGQGRALLSRVNPAYGAVVAMADINPTSLARADEVLAKRNQPPAKHYTEFSEMLQKENIEGVITAVPLWAHDDVVVPCLEAGKHVLCEKMMAWDMAGCQRMRDAAVKNNRVLEIGYQRHYNAVYLSAYEGIVKRGLLGDVYHARIAWHRNGPWRRTGTPPSPDYDASKWGYPTFEHLLNWRLYWKYSRGLFAELCSHQLNAVNWFLGSAPIAVQSSGGVYRYKDNSREAHDHVYAIFEYPNGLTATFSSVESNAFDERYEAFFGTKATLVIHNEVDAFLFEEGAGAVRPTTVEVSATPGGAAVDASETKPAAAGGATRAATAPQATAFDRASSTENEISRFCAAIRTGRPVACGPDKAMESARACIAATEAAINPGDRKVTL